MNIIITTKIYYYYYLLFLIFLYITYWNGNAYKNSRQLALAMEKGIQLLGLATPLLVAGRPTTTNTSTDNSELLAQLLHFH